MNDEQKRKELSSSLQRRPRSSTGKISLIHYPALHAYTSPCLHHQPSEHRLTMLPSQENQQVAFNCGGERTLKKIPHHTTGQEDRPTLPTGTRGNRKESQGRNHQRRIRCNLQAVQEEGMCHFPGYPGSTLVVSKKIKLTSPPSGR